MEVTFTDSKYPVQKRWQMDGSVTYYFQGNCGDASMRVYALFPGVKLIFHEVHREDSHLGASKKGEQIEIHYCMEGRMEHMLADSCFCLTSGDLGIHKVKKGTTEFVLPMRHYHGITISIHTDLAMRKGRCIWERMEMNPMDLVARLCADNPCFVIRRQESLQRLFSEFY